MRDEPVETDAYKSFVRYEPLGTILGIMPWNFPFWQVFGPVAPVSIARDTSEAMTLSRTTKFGPGVSLFTNDLEKAGKFVAEFKDGAVFKTTL